MRKIPSIKSVMTPFPYSVDANAPLSEAQEFMRKEHIRHLPVTDDGNLVGMISDRDITLVLGPDFAYPDAQELKVREVMITDTYTVDLGERLDRVLAHMVEHHFDAATITRHGKLVGVFTATDACREFQNFLLRDHRRSGGGDAA